MAESKRTPQHAVQTKDEAAQERHDRLTLVAFLLGGIAIVSGMLWLADGLSNDFQVTSVSFILFAGLGVLTAAIWILNTVLDRRAA